MTIRETDPGKGCLNAVIPFLLLIIAVMALELAVL